MRRLGLLCALAPTVAWIRSTGDPSLKPTVDHGLVLQTIAYEEK